MAQLKDYIQEIMQGIAEARASADRMSKQIAEEYANDEILRHFSIPRMRIGDVEIDIPVAIDTATTDITLRKNVNPKSVNNSIVSKIAAYYKLKENDERIKHLLYEMQDSNIVEKTVDNFAETQNIASVSDFSDTIVKMLQKMDINVNGENTDVLSRMINNTFRAKVFVEPIEKLDIIAESSRLKEQDSKTIINVKLKLIEDGMEWAVSEDENGNIKQKLVHE